MPARNAVARSLLKSQDESDGSSPTEELHLRATGHARRTRNGPHIMMMYGPPPCRQYLPERLLPGLERRVHAVISRNKISSFHGTGV